MPMEKTAKLRRPIQPEVRATILQRDPAPPARGLRFTPYGSTGVA